MHLTKTSVFDGLLFAQLKVRLTENQADLRVNKERFTYLHSYSYRLSYELEL
jgi:hypothetical protein